MNVILAKEARQFSKEYRENKAVLWWRDNQDRIFQRIKKISAEAKNEDQFYFMLFDRDEYTLFGDEQIRLYFMNQMKMKGYGVHYHQDSRDFEQTITIKW